MLSAPSRIIASALRGLGLSRQAARYEARIATRAFGYDGAAGGRRLKHAGEIPLPLSQQLAARQPLAWRGRYLAANNGFAAAGVTAWESALIGTGIKPQSGHPDPMVRKRINAAFAAWTDRADADGLLDFYGMQTIVARRLVTDGEHFGMFVHGNDDAFRVRLMDAEQCNGSYHSELANGARIVAGVEFDGAGRRVAYHVWKQRLGLPVSVSLELLRIPAEDMVHVFKPEQAGQVRGISWFAPILLRLADLDSSHDAQLMRQKISALLTGFIVDPNGQAAGFEGQPDGNGNLDGGLEPGVLKTLLPGQDIRFSDPANIGAEAIEFLKITAREIAAGLGVPYEQLTGDLSGVNFSSIRAGLVEFRRRVEAVQFNVVVHRFCRPIWRRFVTTEILAGRIDAPGFERDPEPYLSANWLPPKTDWVDPLKDAEAEILAINAGLMSRREAVAMRGRDLELLDDEIAADKAAAEKLGLSFSTFAMRPAQQQNSSRGRHMNLDVLTRAAPLAPSSWNSDARSFDVTFATETPVERRDARGLYFEVLSMDGMETASAELPVLNSHARGSLSSQIGSAGRIRAVGGEALASVRLSRANPIADRVAIDLDGGQTFGVSTGYIIKQAKETARDGSRYITATRWTVVEISLTPIPADPRTGIRGLYMTVENQPGTAPEPNPMAVAERTVINTEIRSIARIAGLDQPWIEFANRRCRDGGIGSSRCLRGYV